MRHLLFHKRNAEPEGFDQAVTALLAAGYRTAISPARTTDGVRTVLQKTEEVHLEFSNEDGLLISASLLPTERLKSEIDALLQRTLISEAPVI